jgi:hypothetical protein
MVDDDYPLSDRLADRSLVDQYGFLLFATGGIVGILLSKYAGLPVWLISVFACFVMVAYAAIVRGQGTGRLRSDQAGDNCYYLGLLFTLTSLGYAIFTFDPADTATTIVQGFGVALATTILGLVLRVFFNQSRVDLFEVEDSARLELAEAAGQLKKELSDIALSFRSFADGIQQSIVEVRDDAHDRMVSLSTEAMTSLQAATEKSISAMSSSAEKFGAEATTLSQKIATVGRSLEKHQQVFEESADLLAEFSELASAVGKVSDVIRGNSEALAVQSEQALNTQKLIQTSAEGLRAAVTSTDNDLGGLTSQFRLVAAEMEEQLKRLADAPQEEIKAALEQLAKASKAVADATAQASDQQIVAMTRLGTASDGLIAATQQHNASLEYELSRSRSYVQQVHSALVEMTAKLNSGL